VATLLGLIPMALGVEAGSEQYAPLARAVIGDDGLRGRDGISGAAVYLLIHGRNVGKQWRWHRGDGKRFGG